MVSSRWACSLKLVPCHTMVVITRTYVRSAKASPTVTHLFQNQNRNQNQNQNHKNMHPAAG